ncbi:MAG: nitroreductase family protein [Gemmatimonadota bacterium]|nr:MAG: nitroreductase family protein [Gemmatimonadota bacterium]
MHSRRDFMMWTVAAGTPLAIGASLKPDLRQEPSFFETVRSRRSVRRYQPTPVPDEHLREILDAARLAPTSGNQQPWKFLVVRDSGLIDRMKEACIEKSLEARRARGLTVSDEMAESVRESFQGYFSAPVYVVVLTDSQSRYPTYNHWDGPLAAGYLMLAARALGYGTVFITDSIPTDVTKEVLNIPDRYTRVCITPIGVPETWPDSPDKKELDEFIVYDRF